MDEKIDPHTGLEKARIVKMTSMTLVGFFERGFPAAHGNCFSAALEDGTGVRILNFHYENLKELLRRGTLVWPVQVHIIRKGYAVIADPRVPNEWYQKDFCEVCAPMELLPLPQRLRFAMAVERGEIEVNGDSITCRILPADQPRKFAIGWTIKEKIGVCVVNAAGIRRNRIKGSAGSRQRKSRKAKP